MTAYAAPRHEALALGLAAEAERVQAWPGLGRRAPGVVRLLVVADSAALQHATRGRAPAWGAAVALPGARAIVVRADDVDLPRTVRHELAHLVLHDAVRGRVPLWFDEGYAAWAAEGWGAAQVARVHLAVLRGGVPALEDLAGALRGSAFDAPTAYALAASAVLELANRHPSGSLAPLLTRLGAGDPFPDAVRATTGLTLGQFDVAWRQGLRRRYGGLVWAAGAMGWALVALGVLWAARQRRRRDAPRRAALDDGWLIPEPSEGQELDPSANGN